MSNVITLYLGRRFEIVGIRQYLRMADLSREGALDSESVNGFDDVLRISEHLDDYVLLPNINTDAELGQFLVDTGYKNFPEVVRPYLDYRAVGAEYCAEHGGVYSPGGYVRRKCSVEQVANELALGIEEMMQKDGVRRAEFGLIRRCSRPFSEEAQGQQLGGIQ